MSSDTSKFLTIFIGLFILLVIVLGAYAVSLVMGIGNVLLYSTSSAMHVTYKNNLAPISVFYIIFYVIISAIIVIVIMKMITAIKSTV